jgi:hypothetical protein
MKIQPDTFRLTIAYGFTQVKVEVPNQSLSFEEKATGKEFGVRF